MWSRVQKVCVWALIVTLLGWSGVGLARAADAVVSQTFSVDGTAPAGSLVARQASNSQKVVAATPANRANLVGVVVNKSETFVSYITTANGNVEVATSGAVPLNVSTINGDIKAGDQLTSSPISGFAMKATGYGKVIGRAANDFSRSTSGAQIRTVNDDKGKPTEVAVGQVPVTIAIADWSAPSGLQNVFVDNLQAIGGQLTGKQVGASNAVIAALVLAIGVLVSGIVLFSSVSASMHSLGRNPLSHRVIRRGLTQVILIVIALMVVSIVVAYIIIGR